ncbi:MAG TPA: Crp/Fnr family transcriptional regulator [Methylomirabilota bacterium]|nr:Crp/Fnr family transcriptional regulator [Methylomirabilota bacterium]
MKGVEFLRRLEAKGIVPRVLSFRSKENLYREGEPGITLFVLLQGKVTLTIHTPDGGELGLAVLGPGDVFGELALTTGERYVTAHALTDVDVAVVRADETKALARDDPELLDDLLSLVDERLRRAVAVASEILTASLSVRMARHLLALANPEPASGDLEVLITQEELATLVGATREAVNRELRRLARRGWLRLGRRRIVLLRPDELARFTELVRRRDPPVDRVPGGSDQIRA